MFKEVSNLLNLILIVGIYCNQSDVEPETTYHIQVQAATGAGFPPRNSAEAMKHTTPAVNGE